MQNVEKVAKREVAMFTPLHIIYYIVYSSSEALPRQMLHASICTKVIMKGT